MQWYLLLSALLALAGLVSLIATVLVIESDEDEEVTEAEPIVFRLRAS